MVTKFNSYSCLSLVLCGHLPGLDCSTGSQELSEIDSNSLLALWKHGEMMGAMCLACQGMILV